jgi:hypothetical protein
LNGEINQGGNPATNCRELPDCRQHFPVHRLAG